MEMNERGYKIKGPHWNALRCYSNAVLKVNSSLILIDSSTGSPVHVLMLSIQAMRDLR